MRYDYYHLDPYTLYPSNRKKFAHINLSNLVNLKVLGTIAKTYAEQNGITIEGGKSIRDYLNKTLLEKIKDIEVDLHGYIKYANITDYEVLKEKIGV